MQAASDSKILELLTPSGTVKKVIENSQDASNLSKETRVTPGGEAKKDTRLLTEKKEA